jgi:hypothetical protein
MGFLKRLGVRKQAAALKPFMRSDEHVAECDVLSSASVRRAAAMVTVRIGSIGSPSPG